MSFFRTSREQAMKEMGATIMLIAAVAVTATACSDKKEPSKEELAKAAAVEAHDIYLRTHHLAEFTEQATYGNCKIGEMRWHPGGDNWTTGMQVTICDGTPTTSVEYRSGKRSVGNSIIGTKALSEEEIKAKQDAEERDAALNKLTDKEKALLGAYDPKI